MSIKENKELVRRYLSSGFADAIRKSMTSGIDDFHAPECVVHMHKQDMNLKEYYKFNDAVFAAFPDIRFSAEDIVSEGAKVAARYEWNGTQKGTFFGVAPTGKKVSVANMGIFKMAKGRIIEIWDVVDVYGLMQQLGAIPSAPPKR